MKAPKFKKGDEVVCIGRWYTWQQNRAVIIKKLNSNYGKYVVDFNPSGSWSEEKYVQEDCIVLKSIFNSPLYKALL